MIGPDKQIRMLELRQATHDLCDTLLGQLAGSARAVRIIEQTLFSTEHGFTFFHEHRWRRKITLLGSAVEIDFGQGAGQGRMGARSVSDHVGGKHDPRRFPLNLNRCRRQARKLVPGDRDVTGRSQ